ncbi:hypothetical protein JTE90_027746 [Oedothorax gibbosus]|uniref:Uncharacterized protein n=1 Tax=Oedothorax gibbosus TaxID=931172 RepID=A0AAV6TDH3_9ARAC|nr:hypothetical protein JTE90_027746 [Oedothorax gibbosus]
MVSIVYPLTQILRRFAASTATASTRVPLASSVRQVHHLSSNVCAQTPPLPQVDCGGFYVRPPRGTDPTAAASAGLYFLSPPGYSRPIDSRLLFRTPCRVSRRSGE